MPTKFTITETISNADWGSVDKTALRNILVQGLEEGAEGIREVIREVYAVIRGENLEDAPSQNWVMPHHEVRENGNVVLNRGGLIAAVQALAGARAEPNLTTEQKRTAARHLMRHYRQLELEPPESLKNAAGETASVQAVVSGEMAVNDVPLASWADLEALKAGDSNPMEVVVEIPAGKSKRGWNYTPEALQKIVGEVMSQGLPGFLGHQKPEDVDSQFPIPVTHWVGAKYENGKAYFRGVVDKAADDLKRWIKSKAVRTVSIFGIPKLQQSAGETNVVDYKPLSIDWTPLGRAGMDTAVVAIGEMDEIIGGEKMDWKELVKQLKQKIDAKEVSVAQVVGELDSELLKYKEIFGEISIAEEAKKAMEEKVAAEHEKLIDDAIKGKVSGEMAQALVKKMLNIPKDATKEQIAGEINKILQDDIIKEAIGKFYVDKPPIIGDEKQKQTSLRTKRQAI
ncbi:hypothetical protein [Tepidanaerobacter syntrophicus]|uniref:hypothetical protein n=1 Tax=Tepidanaerobacter syntrophicus TaxID=224999 RepID=UPI001BD55C1A|nr:hypothetical protein [Tepidanaerobacter syntrophicus]